ncbi:MAG: hypothetical protein L6V93_18785 [Clostridiales bacterium]|nr:MAG: hypothetical protein L6V93_18785 [Clostridiales bacterium]
MEREMGIFRRKLHALFGRKKPFSEPETQAVKALFEKEKFDISVAFHSQGEEIYCDFANASHYRHTADALAGVSGYTVAKLDGIASVTGFKDWVTDKFSLPAFTVEVGKRSKIRSRFSQFEKNTKGKITRSSPSVRFFTFMKKKILLFALCRRLFLTGAVFFSKYFVQ